MILGMKHIDGRLIPYSMADGEQLQNLLSNHEVVTIKLIKKRGVLDAIYGAFVGYLRKALAASGSDYTDRELRNLLKKAAGYAHVDRLPEQDAEALGRKFAVFYVSTSHDNMSEADFREFVQAVFTAVETTICPHLLESEWGDNVAKIITEFRAYAPPA